MSGSGTVERCGMVVLFNHRTGRYSVMQPALAVSQRQMGDSQPTARSRPRCMFRVSPSVERFASVECEWGAAFVNRSGEADGAVSMAVPNITDKFVVAVGRQRNGRRSTSHQ